MSIFKNWPIKQNQISGDTLYADIVNHCGNWREYFFQGDKFTTAHESTHSCNADIRNGAGGVGVNGFYVGFNRAIVVPEPSTRKSDCVRYIPQSLRGARYNLYIAGQQEWDDRPLYIFDEFVAYINGSWTMIELKKKENYTENVVIEGPVEFISYAVATMMAADHANSLNDTLVKFGKWTLRRAYNSYFEGLQLFGTFDPQEKIYQIQKSGSDWEQHRQFLRDKLKFEVPTGVVPENDNGDDDDHSHDKIDHTP